MFTDSLLVLNHWLILSNSMFTVENRVTIYLLIGSKNQDAFRQPFIWRRNRNGSSIETWWTPHEIGVKDAFKLLYNMNCLGFLNSFKTIIEFFLYTVIFYFINRDYVISNIKRLSEIYKDIFGKMVFQHC